MSRKLTIEEYSEKAFVVRGETKKYKDQLIDKNGKWNPNLKGGAGWIFSKMHLATIRQFVTKVNGGLSVEPNTVQSDTPHRKRKIHEVSGAAVRERYEKVIRQKIIEELTPQIEEKVRSEYNRKYYELMRSPSRSPVRRLGCTGVYLLLFVLCMVLATSVIVYPESSMKQLNNLTNTTMTGIRWLTLPLNNGTLYREDFWDTYKWGTSL